MISKPEKDVLIEHALENVKHFRVAVKVGSTFDDLRMKVIELFLERLKNMLQAEFNEPWRVEHDFNSEGGFSPYQQFHVSKWNERRIALESQTRQASRFAIGIWKEEGTSSPTDLKEALDKALGHGSSNKYWDWCKWVDSEYTDWRDDSLLVRMYEGDSRLMDYFSEYFVAIKTVAEVKIH